MDISFPDFSCGPRALPHMVSSALGSQEARPLLRTLTPSAVHSFDIVRLVDVQEALKWSDPQLVGMRKLVGPGYHLVQAPCLLHLQ